MTGRFAEIYIPVKPRPKQRPRMGRGGHVYTPKETHDIEAAIAGEWSRQVDWTAEGPVKVTIEYDKDGQHVRVEELGDVGNVLRGDLDNYVKATLDGLNKVAFKDDRQVVVIHATKTDGGHT